MKHFWRASAVTAACCLLTACQPQKTGLFSNMIFESGKVHGVEIFIIRGGISFGGLNDFFAYVQCANGSPGRPTISEVKIHGFELVIPAIQDKSTGCPATEFRGVVSFDGITGQFAGTPTIKLPRRDSIWE